jgi:phosphoribosylformylglycinamidine synthase I
MNASVVIFPGSNCDRDVLHALGKIAGIPAAAVWHKDSVLPERTDLVVLPGGFSYGDYLRCGAMAARSPIIQAVREHAKRGGLVLGICNGFQILTEANLLPGALLPNSNLEFICSRCLLRVERSDTPFTNAYPEGSVVQFPIAHHEGLYYLPDEDLRKLEENRQVVFRYASADGSAGIQHSPNGSLNGIAGIVNDRGNVLGLMPHPERASESLLGGTDGLGMWNSIKTWLEGGAR